MLGSSVHATQEAGVSSQHQNSSGTSTHDHLGDDGYHGVVQQEYFLPHKDMYLRKGKWTAEEERYANKVIEYFNGGVLKLDDHERGITLRAYLAQKLGCDPMRITKKYTGASCLGKRVYHAFKQGGKSEEVDRATADLNALEDDFRLRLQQMNKRRGGTYTETMVSTPGIESMLNQAGYPAGWSAQPGMTYGYPVPGYNAVDTHIKQQRQRHHQFQPTSGRQNGGQSSAEASPYTSPLEQLSRTARSYSSDQTTAADHSPSLTGLRYTDSAETHNDHDWTNTGTSSSNGNGRTSFSGHVSRSGSSSANRKGSDGGSTSSGGSSTAQRRTKPHRDRDRDRDRGSKPIAMAPPPDPLQRVKVSAHDTEAASSLLGFFTQLERNSSQEDMLHFFEGVQKTAAAAATVAAVQSPPKVSVKSESGGGFSGSGGGDGKDAGVIDFPSLPPPAYVSNTEAGVDC